MPSLLIALSVCLPAAPITNDPVPEFGIVAFDLRDPVPARLSALGVGVVRGSCGWPMLEPARGTFDWACADNVIIGAERLGIRSYLTVGCTPAWANGGAGCGAMPSNIVDWYQFVQAFVARYERFRAILGVWNEPNLTLRDAPDGANYALLFVNASSARNAVNPRFPIAGPETSHHALASGYYVGTMDYIQRARALNPQDIVAVHWYPDGPPLVDYMDAVSANGVAGTNDVWLSEVGVATADARREADFYRDTLAVFSANANPRWSSIIFYRLWDGQPCCSESILHADYSAKPAYHALQRAIERFRLDRRVRERRRRTP